MVRTRAHLARKLRRQATDAESHLWYALRQCNTQWKFRRQHPIGTQVVDFACPAHKLAIELDGGQHSESAALDADRTNRIEEHGYRVIRFWNHDVLGNTKGVVETIFRELQKRPASPARSARTLSTPKG